MFIIYNPEATLNSITNKKNKAMIRLSCSQIMIIFVNILLSNSARIGTITLEIRFGCQPSPRTLDLVWDNQNLLFFSKYYDHNHLKFQFISKFILFKPLLHDGFESEGKSKTYNSWLQTGLQGMCCPSHEIFYFKTLANPWAKFLFFTEIDLLT